MLLRCVAIRAGACSSMSIMARVHRPSHRDRFESSIYQIAASAMPDSIARVTPGRVARRPDRSCRAATVLRRRCISDALRPRHQTGDAVGDALARAYKCGPLLPLAYIRFDCIIFCSLYPCVAGGADRTHCLDLITLCSVLRTQTMLSLVNDTTLFGLQAWRLLVGSNSAEEKARAGGFPRLEEKPGEFRRNSGWLCAGRC